MYKFKKILSISLSTFLISKFAISETVYAPAVTVTGGEDEAESLSGSGTYIGSETIQSNNYDNIDQFFFIKSKKTCTLFSMYFVFR